MKTHILLIDDDIDEMKTFVEALKEVVGAFKCTYAANGIHALKMLLYLRPEAIFAACNMPAMDGLQVAEEVKKINHLQDIPFFLYAPNFNTATREKALQLGVSGCLEKPSTTSALSTLLKRVLPVPQEKT